MIRALLVLALSLLLLSACQPLYHFGCHLLAPEERCE
jgi:hypothetical protein